MFNTKEIEKKWQNYWKENKLWEASNSSDKEKYYLLVEFPYPSGSGLHVGHVRSYTALDAMARLKRMKGYNVLFPMGWDAFGAPAEQYAIKNHIHPRKAVEENIKTFKGQLESMGYSFDWTREFSTTDPEYYKWTQWQFLKFYEAGLAYKDEKEINWCPNCKTGLSNEDSAGGVCERCGSRTEKKLKNQWMLKMTAYADKLLEGLDKTEFLDKIKTAQINWIGKSTGAEVNFKLSNTEDVITVFTTRCDTLFGATALVLSPEHEYLKKYEDKINNIDEVKKYQIEAKNKSEIERTDATKKKTGVKIDGLTAINPVNDKEVEIWISDYVLSGYGTGAIMMVASHDERDFDFAKKFGIEIIPVIEQITGTKRENEQEKNSIVAVVYDEKKDKYLTINWGELGGRLFIGGTRKDNESPIECAKREITEETGYKNIEYVSECFPLNHHYFAYNKNIAYNIESTGLLFKLIDDEKVNTNLDEEEKDNFKVEWASLETILSEVKDELHITTFNNLRTPKAYTGQGRMINSDFLNGITDKQEAINKMLEYLEEKKVGKKTTNYRLQDWIFSRQRFWGEPIPMVYCETCGWVAVPYEELPVLLPEVTSYEPTETGESPLSNVKEWVNTTCPHCGAKATRETDTMPNWAGSSWYWLRYMDAKNDKEFANFDVMKYWEMVDLYNGGMEHATRHLLYARFWHEFLYDQGLVPTPEPFKKRVAHGMILNSDGKKFSKSSGNGVKPDDMVKKYGADALRTFEMFIGDYEKDASWNEEGLRGCKRFIDRIYKLQNKLNDNEGITETLESIIHKTIKKVTIDIETMNFNTAVSALMILTNEYEKLESISKSDYRILLTLLNPIAPHITEELVSMNDLGRPICETPWPTYDEAKMIDKLAKIAVQINGKLRGTMEIPMDTDKDELIRLAKELENVKKHLIDKEIIKEIVVPNKIVNLVIK